MLDLMVTPEGRVKVLEFQGLANSGFSGFQKAYGRNLQTVIAEDRASLPLSMRPPPFLFDRICGNKAQQATFAFPLCPDFFPRQKACAYTGRTTLMQEAADTFPGAPVVVIKVPEAAQGDGVFFLDMKAARIAGMEPDRQQYLFGNFLNPHDPVRLPRQTHVILQELVDPRPVTLQGKQYAPTIRTVMTVGWDENNPDAFPETFIHGSYYKLPRPRTNSLPFSPEEIKSDVHDGMGAARIEKSDREIIAEQVPHIIGKVFGFCLTHDPEDLILKIFEAGDPGDIVSALDNMRKLDRKSHPFSDGFVKKFADRVDGIERIMPQAVPRMFWRTPALKQLSTPVPVDPAEIAARISILTDSFNQSIFTSQAGLDRLKSLRSLVQEVLESDLDAPVMDVRKNQSRRVVKKLRQRAVEKARSELLAEKFAGSALPPDLKSLTRAAPDKLSGIIDARMNALNQEIRLLRAGFARNADPDAVRREIEAEKAFQMQSFYTQHLTG